MSTLVRPHGGGPLRSLLLPPEQAVLIPLAQTIPEWLKERYPSTSALNKAWGLAFWSLELGDWEELELPTATNHFPHNPSLLLDYRRFTSAMTWTPG